MGVGGEGWRAVAEVVGMGELLLNAGSFEVVRWMGQDLFDQRLQKSGNVFMVVIGEYRDFDVEVGEKGGVETWTCGD